MGFGLEADGRGQGGVAEWAARTAVTRGLEPGARLDLEDRDLARGQRLIRSGKGRKDRVVPVVGRAAAALDVYLRDARPELVKDPARDLGRVMAKAHPRERTYNQPRIRTQWRPGGV